MFLGSVFKIAAIKPFLTFGIYINSEKQKSTVGSIIKLSVLLIYVSFLVTYTWHVSERKQMNDLFHYNIPVTASVIQIPGKFILRSN